MKNLSRMFSTASVKGKKNYLNSQKKYEVIRTILYFAISISLYIAGYLQTKTQANLLTIVSVLGFLPASKSAVEAVMYLRYHSASEKTTDAVAPFDQKLLVLYDCAFTSYKKTYLVAHLAVRGNVICGYAEDKSFPESEFYAHINDHLKLDGHKNITIKIFTNMEKYTERLNQMVELEDDKDKSASIAETLKSVML